MLDRVLLGVSVVGALASIMVFRDHRAAASVCGIGLVLSLLVLRQTWLRRIAIEPSSSLRERAGRVARLFPAPVIVMGHTHLPEVVPSSAQCTYVNLGGWAEAEASKQGAPGSPATRTHLVLTRAGAATTAQLMTWHDGAPHPFQPV